MTILKYVGMVFFTLGITLFIWQEAVADDPTEQKTTHNILTNAVSMKAAPKWLEEPRVDKVVADIQDELEWYIRRIPVYWYQNQDQFEKAHRFGKTAVAVTKQVNGKQSIHLGPKVTDKTFDRIFAHELVHLIFRQKYKGAIPKWLEEGFANHLSSKKKVDYDWLASKPLLEDVTKLSHPYSDTSETMRIKYKTSQALVEMLAEKCDLENLLRLSVQRKMQTFIRTYCEIKDINVAFRSWVKSKAKDRTNKVKSKTAKKTQAK